MKFSFIAFALIFLCCTSAAALPQFEAAKKTVTAAGAVIKLPKIAKLVIAPDTVRNPVMVSLQTSIDDAEKEDIDLANILYSFADRGELLRINFEKEAPLKAITIFF